jgi:hypothetical protein
LLLGFLRYTIIQFKMKNIFRKIKRLIAFIPIIWKGDDFDYRYAIDLFQFQLSRLADYIEKNDRYVGSENDVARIRLVCRLMTKVYDEEYAMEYMDTLEKKYGKGIMDWEFKKNEETGHSTMMYKYENREDAGEIEKTHSKLLHESHKKQERAHRLLWQLIEKDIRKWWD